MGSNPAILREAAPDQASRRKRIEDDLREQPEASESKMTLVSNRGFLNKAVGGAVMALVERAMRLGPQPS